MNEQDIELIERFLKGELSKFEKEQTEQRLSLDRDFRRRVEVFRELQQMHTEEVKDFRALLNEVQQDYQQELKTSRKRTYWLVAASISVLGIVSVAFFYLIKPAADTQELYAQYFAIPADNLSVRGEDASQALLNEAMQYYNAQEYHEASLRFEAWLQQYPDSAPVLFYSGISHMAEDNMSQAIVQLQKISSDSIDTGQYRSPASWYLALAYLKSNQQKAAGDILEKLAEGSTTYAAKAKNLIEDMQ